MRRYFRSSAESKEDCKSSSRGDAKDDDDDDDDDARPPGAALVAECAKFCLSGGSLDRWRAFMESREASFAAGERAGDEHRLEHTEIHAEFCALVEASLAAWLEGRGHDTASFYRVCERLSRGADRDDEAVALVQTFVQLMLMALEYAAFADVMRDREKRRYFFGVLGQWRDAL